MNKYRFVFIGVVFMVNVAVFSTGCGDDNASPVNGSAATVRGTLTLPAEAEGKSYWVLIDNDLDGGNGFLEFAEGGCGSGTEVDYSISDVPAGTYFLYAGVRVVSQVDNPPQSGDYVGYYGGTLLNPPTGANAVVPSSGTVTFDITLAVM